MSSKKPVDHIEERIKLAAENSIAPFDEKAWEAMEAKLEGDNKKRRPFAWWLILPLLITAGIWGAYKLKNSSEDNRQEMANTAAKANDEKQTAGNTSGENKQSGTDNNTVSAASPELSKNDDDNKQALINSTQQTSTAGAVPVNTTANKNNSATALLNTQGAKHKDASVRVKTNMPVAAAADAGGGMATARSVTHKRRRKNTKGKISSAISGGETTAVVTDDKTETNKAVNNDPVVAAANDIVTSAPAEKKNGVAAESTPAINPDATKKKEEAPEKKEKTKEKKDKKQAKGFYLLAAIGSDAGSTKLFSYSNSKITPRYGVGIGYRLNDRFSIQTGFYVTNKKYVAGKDDYAAKQTPYWQYLTRVKAACLMYEIPLCVRVNLINKPSLSVYGAIGASSYIMKKEDYDYVYTYNSMEHAYPYEYRGNKHLFSTLTFSAGIEKRLSDKFSLIAEPSFGVPLKGVGDGRVRLYSSSLMAGLKYNFSKSK